MSDADNSIPLSKTIDKNTKKSKSGFSIVPLEGRNFEDLSAREVLNIRTIINKAIDTQQKKQRLYRFDKHSFIYKSYSTDVVVLAEDPESEKDWIIFESNGTVTPISHDPWWVTNRTIKRRIKEINEENMGIKIN